MKTLTRSPHEHIPLPSTSPDDANTGFVSVEDEVGRFDHPYVRAVVLLRWLITACYPAVVLAGIIPMHPLALAGSGAWLAGTSALATWHWRRGPHHPLPLYESSYIFLDVLSVTFGVLAAASLTYPIWLVYVLLMIEGSAERTARFSIALSFCCVGAYLLCAVVLDASGWYQPNFGAVAITVLVMLFAGIDLTITFDGSRRLRAYIRRLAVTDPLTGLANRRRLSEALAREPRHGREVAVIILDLDNFKRYNDAHGHLAGDRLLVRLARALQTAFPEASAISRYGGDEFVVLLPCVALEDVEDRVRRLILDPPQGPLPVSAGLAVWPRHEATLDGVLAAADDCLRVAKRTRKGGLVTAATPAEALGRASRH
ncbi:MAG: GGDEF domain-containing protein [Dehalococcoidia bacterium]|nr:GGDEF domain-containing protein [Dehalococcoidia bacterium]